MRNYEKLLFRNFTKETTLFEKLFLGPSPTSFEIALFFILKELKERRIASETKRARTPLEPDKR